MTGAISDSNNISREKNGANESENIALIGFKHEPSDPVDPPLQVKLSEVSSQLFSQDLKA